MPESTRGLIPLLAAAVFLAGAVPAQSYTVAAHSDKPAAKVYRYWTPERMRSAVPAALGTRPQPQAKPGGGGGTKPGSSTEVPTPYPNGYGKVFFTENGVNYVCSGTALASTNQSVVWTAGHCVNEGPGDFVTNFLFVPAFRDGSAPYGRFAGETLLTTSGWLGSGEFGVDLGAAVVGTNASGQTLSAAVAERPIVFGATRDQSYSLYGYPAAKRFSGQRLRVCNTTWMLDDTSATPATMGAQCDMTGGSSGGAWVTSTGAVASVISYGYASLRNVLFGPHQESDAQQLYNSAQSP
jgi:V8-like Glu-specific endopeptidase